MSCNSRSALFLLRRLVAVGRLTTLSAGVATGGGGAVTGGGCGGGGLVRRASWTWNSRAERLRSLCRLQPPLRSSLAGLCTKAPCEDEYPPLPAYPPEPEPEKRNVHIVQVKGLPWSCTAQDLLQFFSECRVREGLSGIHLTVDRLGRPSGRAFIEMEHEEDVSRALEKHRQYLGPRYVEVYELMDSDAEAILKNAAHSPAPPPADTRVVRLRGLPFTSTQDDIVHFFSGLDILENGITLVTNSRGRRTGEAYVWFSSQQAADEALQRDRQHIGHRYIEVFPSSSHEIRSGPAPPPQFRKGALPAQPPPTTAAAPPPTPPLHYVHMRGLPFNASGEDIVQFFAPLVVSKIVMECGADGRPGGEADVYFRRHQDAVEAVSRDRMHMGGRYIELFLNSDPDDATAG